MNSKPQFFFDGVDESAMAELQAKSGRFLNVDVVAAIVAKKGDVLLIRRDIPGVEARWMFPAGKPEKNEAFFDVAIREVFEETGVYCRAVKIFRPRVHSITKKKIAYVVCEYISDARDKKKEYKTKWLKAQYLPSAFRGAMSKTVKNIINSIKEEELNNFGKNQKHTDLPMISWKENSSI